MDESPDATLALARTAAETIRALNHATLGGHGLAQPADASARPGELSLAASRLPSSRPRSDGGSTSPLPPGSSAATIGTDPAIAVGEAQTLRDKRPHRGGGAGRDLGYAQQQLAAVHGSPSLIADAFTHRGGRRTGKSGHCEACAASPTKVVSALAWPGERNASRRRNTSAGNLRASYWPGPPYKVLPGGHGGDRPRPCQADPGPPSGGCSRSDWTTCSARSTRKTAGPYTPARGAPR